MSLGLDPDAFWSKTPQQVRTIFDGQSRRLNREHNERAWIAWHIYALPRARKPKFKDLIIKDGSRSKRTRQTPDQMLAIAKMMAGMTFPENRSPRA